MKATRRVVIIRPGALGDTLLAFPALAALRRTWPAAHVTLVARADMLSLARASGLADTTADYDLPVWARLWAGTAAGDPELRAALAGADTIVAWVADPDTAVARGLRAVGARRMVVAPGRPRTPVLCATSTVPANASGAAVETTEHAAAYLLHTLAPLGIVDAGGDLTEMPPLVVPTDARMEAAAMWDALGLGGPARVVVALHPGSGGAAKCWPAARFANTARGLAEAGWRPLLVEGPADGPVVARVLAGAGGVGVPVVRGVRVDVLAALVGRCAAYVGNDSGVTHLAAMAGCPTLALFGPTDPAVWAPLGPHVRVLRAGETGAVAATESGGARRGGRATDGAAMDGLSEETVWEALAAMLATA